MTFRNYIFLFLFGLAVPFAIAQFQPNPGYLDSDYYFAGGIQLATGHGFTEPYLWNYLDGTTSLPHPSHSYWMPLASIVSALGMWVTGQITYPSARLFFFIIAALVPPVTASLAFFFSKKRELAIASGLLAVFSVYNAPFIAVTDNFGLFMLFGGLYFIVATKLIEDATRVRNWLFLGLLAGLMTLSRSDGLLWLALTFLFTIWQTREVLTRKFQFITRNSFLALLGFLLIMSPWYLRNLNIFDTLMAPGGSRALWLDNYDQTFIYPPSLLNIDSFLALGWKEILSDRLTALGSNLLSAFAAHGGILLFPFIIAGIISFRKDERVKLAGLAFLTLFLVMTFIFPFAGSRGAFFHAGAALQPMWWSLAPLGLDAILASLRKRNWGNDQTRVIFRSALVMIAVILTSYVVYLRLFDLGWKENQENYSEVEQFLIKQGVEANDIVIVRNAPGYYLQTDRSAISFPYGDEQTILDVSKQFGAYYLVMEPEARKEPINILYQDTHGNSQFIYLGDVDDTRIYKIEFK
jgi:hypothetical protein